MKLKSVLKEAEKELKEEEREIAKEVIKERLRELGAAEKTIRRMKKSLTELLERDSDDL